MRMRKRKNLDARMARASAVLPRLPLSPARGAETLLVELGCGMGRFACETAAAGPETLVVGVERAASAIVIGMERALRENISNVRFILGDAGRLPEMFAPGTVETLYIHFCDPWPRRKQAPRRLMARDFLRLYRPLLKPNGALRFKTDNAPLFEFALKELAFEGWTVTGCDRESPPEAVMTEYEIKFRAQGLPVMALTAAPGQEGLVSLPRGGALL